MCLDKKPFWGRLSTNNNQQTSSNCIKPEQTNPSNPTNPTLWLQQTRSNSPNPTDLCRSIPIHIVRIQFFFNHARKTDSVYVAKEQETDWFFSFLFMISYFFPTLHLKKRSFFGMFYIPQCLAIGLNHIFFSQQKCVMIPSFLSGVEVYMSQTCQWKCIWFTLLFNRKKVTQQLFPCIFSLR